MIASASLLQMAQHQAFARKAAEGAVSDIVVGDTAVALDDTEAAVAAGGKHLLLQNEVHIVRPLKDSITISFVQTSQIQYWINAIMCDLPP